MAKNEIRNKRFLMQSFHRREKQEKKFWKRELVSAWAPGRKTRAFLVSGEARTLLQVDLGLHLTFPVWAKKVASKLAPG